jgi:hypothetical protein
MRSTHLYSYKALENLKSTYKIQNHKEGKTLSFFYVQMPKTDLKRMDKLA